MASSEQIAAANKLELARGAGQRYLVQRWEDGTPCDKTNQPRKIEVQVRCDSRYALPRSVEQQGLEINFFL